MDQSPSSTNIRPLLVGIFIFLWLGLMMGGYFWAHKPFGAETAVILADFSWPTDSDLASLALTSGTTLLSIMAWLAVTWLATALGCLLFQGALADESAATRLALYAGIGLGFISLTMGLIGLLGLIYRLTAWILLLVLFAVGRKHLLPVWQDFRAVSKPPTADVLQRTVFIYALVSLILTFFIALTPVTAFDSLTYHLRAPRFFIEAHKFVHPVDIPHMGFPLLGQMQFLLGMLLVGDRVPALFHFGYGLFTIILVAAMAKRAFGERAAWFSVMVLLTIPTLFTLMSWPYVDVTLMFYTTAAFYAFMRWRENRENWGWLFVMALMIGLSGGLKYTAIASPIAITLSLIWESRRDGLSVILRRLVAVGGIAVLIVLPWLIENIVTTGNPTYPFFFNDALYWDEWRAWWYDLPGTGLAATAPWRLLLVPLEATIIGTEGTDFYEATIGPFIFGALFVLPFVWRSLKQDEKPILWHMLLFFAINYLLWLNGVARTALLLRARFVFMVFGITAVIGGMALSRIHTLKRPELDIDWMTCILIQITLIFLLFAQVMNFIQINPLPSILGFESANSYITRRLGVYQVVMTELNELPNGSQIVFLWETRSYACRATIQCDPDPILDKFLHLTQYNKFDAQAISDYWHSRGITHVLLYKSGYQFLLDAAEFNPIGGAIGATDQAILQELKHRYLTEVGNWADAYLLYELNP